MKIQSNIAEVTLRYITKIPAKDRPQITSSSSAENLLRPFFQEYIEHYECFYILLLNRSHRVIGIHKISQGGLAGTVVDIRLIFQSAIVSNAQAVILCHNHPSGTLEPSAQDISLTKKVVEAGKIMDINILDHLILTEDSYYSFGDEGRI